MGNEHFVLQEYKWLDFNSEAIVFPDNSRASVVISDLHDPEELRQRVHVPKAFGARFRPAAVPLFPVDLSEDYRKYVAESLQRRKRRNFDDDDASTIDFSEIATPPDLEDRLSKWKSRATTDETVPEARTPAAQGKTSGAGGSQSFSTPKTPQMASQMDSQKTSQRKETEERPQPNADLTNEEAAQNAGLEHRRGMRPASDISAEARDRILAKLNASTGAPETPRMSLESDDEELSDEDDEQGDEPHDDSASEGFEDSEGGGDVPQSSQMAQMSRSSQGAHDRNPSRGAAPRNTMQELPSEDSDMPADASGNASSEPGSSQGYDQGFEKGYESAVEKFRELHSALETVAADIQALRKNVLSEGRDIFLEMIKLTAEGVLRSQLKFSDEALTDLFRSALENLHPSKRISVQAHPETLARLKQQFSDAALNLNGLGKGDGQANFESIEWVAHDKTAPGDFRIVTNDEVVKVDLAHLVTQKVGALAKEIFGPSSASHEDAQDTHSDEEAS